MECGFGLVLPVHVPGRNTQSEISVNLVVFLKETFSMAENKKHPASEHHHNAASHHETAAHHHRQAAHHHNHGNHEEAKKHAASAHEHSEQGHKHSKTAHEHSQKWKGKREWRWQSATHCHFLGNATSSYPRDVAWRPTLIPVGAKEGVWIQWREILLERAARPGHVAEMIGMNDSNRQVELLTVV
jgi:hypothetical protein